VNTLVVAAIGCFFATILGVIVGVLRLSKNWLIGRIMTVYVEVFRNVPLLAVDPADLRHPDRNHPVAPRFPRHGRNDAAGEHRPRGCILNDSVAITNRGMNMPAPLFERGLGTIGVGEFQTFAELSGPCRGAGCVGLLQPPPAAPAHARCRKIRAFGP
jgi:general L-amino acid transport system permease protein